MSELKCFAKITELDQLQKYLFEDSQENDRKTGSWLQSCKVALSPGADILVFGNKKKLVVLSSKWDLNANSDCKITYHITWNGIPQQYATSDGDITCLLCLSIAVGKNNKSHYAPDWTCIAVGFTNGYISFYTEDGNLLLSELLHSEPVSDIKYHCNEIGKNYGCLEINEEIHVRYNNVICCIPIFTLYSTLKACRNLLARVQANCVEVHSPPPLLYKKWLLCSQENITDCIVAGSIQADPFEHLYTASVCGGFDAEYRDTPPRSTLAISVGSNPFIGFHCGLEEIYQPVLTDVAKVVASKLKSAIGQAVPQWMLGQSQVIEVAVSEERSPSDPEEMIYRCGINDNGRKAISMDLSPDGNLCVVTDNFGRVFLIDIMSSFAVRMWKGYKDAKCGWLLTNEEENNRKEGKIAQFLLMYLEKKGNLEIWKMQQGPKIASFTIEKHARLIKIKPSNGVRVDNVNVNQCVILEPCGNLIEICIPFHCAISDIRNSEHSRDVHLLSNLIKYMHSNEVAEQVLLDKAEQLGYELITTEIKLQALNTLSTDKYVTAPVLLTFINALKSIQTINDEKEEVMEKGKRDPYIDTVDKFEKLTKFYSFLNEILERPPNYSSVVADDSVESLLREVCDLLDVTTEEIDNLMAVIPTMSRDKGKKVQFSEDTSKNGEFVSFLSCFAISNNGFIYLQPNISKSELLRICDIICTGVMHGKCSMDTWEEMCKECKIDAGDLLKIIFEYWLNKPLGITMYREMLNFYKIVMAVCNMREKSVKWYRIRRLLTNSNCPLSAITAAIICRAVSSQLYIAKLKLCDVDEDDTDDDIKCGNNKTVNNDWEAITGDECDWNILIQQLSDITFLDTALKYHPKELPASLYCIPYEPPDITLSSILIQGRGSICELVSKWIASIGLDVKYLYYMEIKEDSENKLPKKSVLGVQEGIAEPVYKAIEAIPLKTSEKETLDLLDKLKKIFPFSLNNDCLLCNVSWVYVTQWKDQVDELRIIQSAITAIKYVRDSHIITGCCVMMWNTHLSSICKATARLMNKVGKLPKDRLCKQDIGIGENKLIIFLNLWVEFLDIMIDHAERKLQTPAIQLRYELLWENHDYPEGRKDTSLCQLAIKQKQPNIDVLRIISQIARTLHIITFFAIRFPRPLDNLFNDLLNIVLYSDSNMSKKLPKINITTQVIEARTKFLEKVIAAIIDNLLIPNMDVNEQTHEYTESIKTVFDWIGRVLMLAQEWTVSLDVLRLKLISLLYHHGYDRLAEESVSSINDREQLGSCLIKVLGRRIKNMLKESTSMYSEFSPVVTSWVETLEEEQTPARSSDIKDCLQLAMVTNSLIPENGKHKYLIIQMLDSLEVLSERL